MTNGRITWHNAFVVVRSRLQRHNRVVFRIPTFVFVSSNDERSSVNWIQVEMLRCGWLPLMDPAISSFFIKFHLDVALWFTTCGCVFCFLFFFLFKCVLLLTESAAWSLMAYANLATCCRRQMELCHFARVDMIYYASLVCVCACVRSKWHLMCVLRAPNVRQKSQPRVPLSGCF